ncbi:aldo/keto reductase [Anoxynatronum buryatiense]|uniref:Aldo/keto reductase family protein n=1 Tax=Anoxynatronum buryatiense TaxID=489973 RepID=A0AA45WUP1_9CLOT|nr:aldo/keto reductase [Anoxynatronum buryatiense]SMP48992.1 Aldo/keto reductase family protein [Anoxynatronum buryatiense]
MISPVSQHALGKTQIRVSRLCYGTLTLGPLQRNMTPEAGGRLLCHAYQQGITFFDTAQLYGTYPHLRYLLKQVRRENVVIMTKSYAWSTETAREAVEEALEEMGTHYLDIMLMHEQESLHTLQGHGDALQEYMRLKDRGIIRAVGFSTHRIATVTASLHYPQLQVIFPIFNPSGLGIQDGGIDEMTQALQTAQAAGKAIVGMKPLGGGHLLGNYEEALRFSLEHPLLDAVAVGMQSQAEINANCLMANNLPLTRSAREAAMSRKRKLHLGDECRGCGNCIKRCRQKALSIINGQAVVDHSRCILCSYCVVDCPEFCIKVL